MLNRRELVGGASAAIVGLAKLTDAKAQIVYPNGINEVGVPSFRMLPVRQHCEQWCWAATIASIFAAKGLFVDQEVIVQHLFGSLDCRPATNAEIWAAVRSAPFRDQGSGRYFTADAIVLFDRFLNFMVPNALSIMINDLMQGNPLISGAVGHATAITAIGFLPTPNGPVMQYVIVRDPWPFNQNRRLLRMDEIIGTNFISRIAISLR